MLIKKVADELAENAKKYKCWFCEKETREYRSADLWLCDTECDEAFAENLLREADGYSIHAEFTFDYESSGDSGDGRDDYYKEEEDIAIAAEKCIIKDNKFYGVVCEAFEVESFVTVDLPETKIEHPRNYGGRNYHFYRTKRFKLNKQ